MKRLFSLVVFLLGMSAYGTDQKDANGKDLPLQVETPAQTVVHSVEKPASFFDKLQSNAIIFSLWLKKNVDLKTAFATTASLTTVVFGALYLRALNKANTLNHDLVQERDRERGIEQQREQAVRNVEEERARVVALQTRFEQSTNDAAAQLARDRAAATAERDRLQAQVTELLESTRSSATRITTVRDEATVANREKTAVILAKDEALRRVVELECQLEVMRGTLAGFEETRMRGVNQTAADAAQARATLDKLASVDIRNFLQNLAVYSTDEAVKTQAQEVLRNLHSAEQQLAPVPSPKKGWFDLFRRN